MRLGYICSIVVGLALCNSVLAESSRLLGWWKMDESLGATSLSDSSGYGRHAALGAGVSIVDGKFGKAAHFDGTTDAWARFSLNTKLTNFTMACWFNVPVSYTNNLYPKIFQFNTGYLQLHYGRLGCFNFGIGDEGQERSDWSSVDAEAFKFKIDTWHHLAVTVQREFDGLGGWKVHPIFYLDGVRCSRDAHPLKSYAPDNLGESGYVYIGNGWQNGTRAIEGMLDDVRLYDEALNDNEVLELYYNAPLIVEAGSDQSVYREKSWLQGRVSNSGSFTRRFNATTGWSVVSAPTGVVPIIELPDVVESAVVLPEPGEYVFRLTATNELGSFTDDVSIVRLESEPVVNSAPVVTAQWSSTGVVFGCGAPLASTVTDDSNPGPVRLRWQKVSGPGGVFFDNAFTNETTAYFSEKGSYVVRLEADDGALQGSDEISVTVTEAEGDLESDLLHRWQMDDGAVSTTASDSVGGNTLSFSNHAMLQPGKTGYGLRLPRSNSSASTSTTPPDNSVLTLSTWFYFDEKYVKRAGGNVYQRLFFCKPNFYIIYNLDSNRIDFSTRGVGTGDTQYTWNWGSVALESDRWYHVSFVIDNRVLPSGSRQIMYLNGVKHLSTAIGSAFPGGAPFESPFVVGNNGIGGSRNFDGVLDDVRVYGRGITDEEAELLAVDPDNNHAPVIEVEDEVLVRVGVGVSGLAMVYDDGQPVGGSFATSWSVVGGDSSKVEFADSSVAGTEITFRKTGEFVLRLDAFDGELRSAKAVKVEVAPVGTIVIVK